MADRIVYLVAKRTPAMERSDLTFLDDAQLAALMQEGGLEVVSTTDRDVAVGGKKVRATMFILRAAADNRGVSLRGGGSDGADGGAISVRDEFGNQRQMSLPAALGTMLARVTQAMTGLNNASHLGGPGNHDMPGLQVISGETVAKALDLGLTAAMRGEPKSTCPFPQASAAARQWLRGYAAARNSGSQTADAVALGEAHAAGLRAAKEFDEDDEVGCPYPNGSPLREAWLQGFVEGGGRVE